MLAPSVEVQNLQAARNLIADPARWCKMHLATDREGRPYDVRYDTCDLCGGSGKERADVQPREGGTK
jgi:hypothetical protein